MSGRKTFTAGEVLQAADVNDFLMDQSVMVFAGTAARSSAIPSPTEGMVTYRSDDDALEVYTTDWTAIGGGLVAVKSVLKDDTFSASVTSGSAIAVTDLSITHAVADASNKLIISAFFGAASSTAGRARVGIAVDDGSGLIAVGAAASNRVSVTAGGRVASNAEDDIVTMPSVTFVHTPGAGSKTYQVNAINVNTGTNTLTVNRTESDADNANHTRSVSALVIQEVSV